MTLNSFYGSIDLSIRAVFRRIFFLDTAFLIEKIVMIFIKVLKNIFVWFILILMNNVH